MHTKLMLCNFSCKNIWS